MNNWTLRQRILASFAVIIAIMLLMVVTSYSHLLMIEKDGREVQSDSLPGLFYSAMIQGAWVNRLALTQQVVGQHGDQGLGQADLDKLRVNDEQLNAQIANYEQTIHLEEDRKAFAVFQRYHLEYSQLQAAVLDLYEQKQAEQAHHQLTEKLLPAWLHGQELLAQLIEWNRNYVEDATEEIISSVAAAKLGMLVSLTLALLAAAICGYLLMHAIMKPMGRIVDLLEAMRRGDLSARLAQARQDEFGVIETGFNAMVTELAGLVSQSQRSAIQVTTSVTEIAATSKQQQASASETAATTTEIGATSREIAATSRDLVRTMTEVYYSAEQASALAGSGQLGLARMEDTMRQVMGAAELVNAKLAILNEKAGNINQVVTTIVKVADQTNLLSLNAAIEAEKAGEYGRGFAVVATEVRRLADQTAVATYDIEQMVREIQSAVSAGVMGMDKFSEEVRRGMAEVQQVGEQLSQIIQQTQALAPRVSMVNEGMQAQASGAEQISQALVQLGEATGQTVESLRQASFAIDELNLVANGLRSGVSRFKV
ncbi:methyl-accepting chemotaxis protein [Pseudomonas sp. 2FG]|uniref:methyl-accepting chemotaxis protein n=1 Tax=Pseudomonas sp. 2FG TaxID=2502191 RepID=UPI0010F8553A|nr:methyl-accepting chemotaxis protein [Pseudomonas sp. 2FG]